MNYYWLLYYCVTFGIICYIKDKDISSRINENKEGISDQEILSLLISLIKQRKDSIEQFQKAGREDLIKNEQNEIDVINQYLPKQKSEDETNEKVIKRDLKKFLLRV